VRSDRPPSTPRPRSRTKGTPGYGAGINELEVDEFALVNGAELQQRLLAIFRSPSYKPPVLPNIALELTDLSRKSSISYDDVVLVVQKDPLIVASVLKLAQSPLYGGRPVQSLKDALNRLGINMLRDMVWQVVMGMRLFRVRGYTASMERLQAHATLTAYAARIVAQRAGIAGEHAFLCGLLHDVGWSGTLVAISDSERNPPDPKALFAAVDKMHAEAGAAMAKMWGLSPEIVMVIGHHHDFSPQAKPVAVLIPVLCVAERLADELGLGVEPWDPDETVARSDSNLPGRFELAVTTLKLESKLDQIRELVAEAAEKVKST
jgi:putative nucleotidyltransferase with HDIG domain